MENTKVKQLESWLFASWAASVLAMFGSLYFSEIRQYEPCVLCWYQRILMYPLVLILGLAVIKKDYKAVYYAMWMSGIGALISIYHYSLQKISFIADNTPACGRVPCTGQYINWLGFITIPFLALIAFLIIFTCSLMIWRKIKEEN